MLWCLRARDPVAPRMGRKNRVLNMMCELITLEELGRN